MQTIHIVFKTRRKMKLVTEMQKIWWIFTAVPLVAYRSFPGRIIDWATDPF